MSKMMSARIRAYLDLERAMITLDDAGDPLADRIRDAMIDPVWYALTAEEKDFLNRRPLRAPTSVKGERSDGR